MYETKLTGTKNNNIFAFNEANSYLSLFASLKIISDGTMRIL